MRKQVKTVIKETHDYNAICVSGPMMTKLLEYSKSEDFTPEHITKCVDALFKLSNEGDVVEVEHYADLIDLMK